METFLIGILENWDPFSAILIQSTPREENILKSSTKAKPIAKGGQAPIEQARRAVGHPYHGKIY